ncbi:MAG: hypothetical protein IKK58_06955 [Clostridia bacterium]|nr:hypothetical protein [Clostridia bacterium]
MKKHPRSDTLKEVLKELSVIPLLVLFLSISLLIGYLLPDSFLKGSPIEALYLLTAIIILTVLYTISGIIGAIQKIKARKEKDAEK